MKPTTFYENFAVAYGTIWLVLIVTALITQTHIDSGYWGFYGFPVLALIYACIRRKNKSQAETNYELLKTENEMLRNKLEDYKRNSYVSQTD